MTTRYIDDGALDAALRLLTYPNQLACLVALETGLRIGDVLKIRSESLRKRMTVTESKTHKKRRVSLSDGLLRALVGIAGEVYVFEGRLDKNKHRTRQAVYADLKRAAAALRLRGVSPHSLRKVYAVELAKKYSLTEVQKIMLHDSMEVTLLYALADVLEQRQPLRHRAHK